MTTVRLGRVLSLCVIVGSLGAMPATSAAQQNRTRAAQPGLLERVGSAASHLWSDTRKLLGRVVDWGEAAVDWARKRVASSAVIKSLYGFLRGNPVIQWVSRTGKQVVRRLERSARAMVGTPRPSATLPTFLQRLADWRNKRKPGGRR